MPAPNQDRFASIFIDEIDQEQALPNREPLWNNRQTPLCAHVRGVTLRAHCPARLRPFHRHWNARIYSHPGPVILHSRFKAGYVPNAHGCLLCLPDRKRPSSSPSVSKIEPRSTRPSENGQKKHFPKTMAHMSPGQWDFGPRTSAESLPRSSIAPAVRDENKTMTTLDSILRLFREVNSHGTHTRR